MQKRMAKWTFLEQPSVFFSLGKKKETSGKDTDSYLFFSSSSRGMSQRRMINREH